MTHAELVALLTNAKALGLTEMTIDGNRYIFETSKPVEAIRKPQTVPDVKPEELVKPLSTFDEPTDDEVLFYATPYYDELQAQKAEKAKRQKDGKIDG
jgi:hypothetical protein